MDTKKVAFLAFIGAFSLGMGAIGAYAQNPRFLAQQPQDFAFCLGTTATVLAAPMGSNEIGMVISNIGNNITNGSGRVVVAANNKYGSGAGSEWTSDFTKAISLPGGSCYNIATMAKVAGPDGSVSWACGVTNGSPSGFGASFTGTVMTETQFLPIVAGQVQAGVTVSLNNAPVVNCPY